METTRGDLSVVSSHTKAVLSQQYALGRAIVTPTTAMWFGLILSATENFTVTLPCKIAKVQEEIMPNSLNYKKTRNV